MGNKAQVAGTQPNTMKISSDADQTEIEAVENFLSGSWNLRQLLRSLGLQKTPRRFLPSKDPLRPIGHGTLSRTNPYLFRSNTPEFPQIVAERLMQLSCPQLLAAMPFTAKVADPNYIVDCLLEEFSQEPERLAAQLAPLLQKDKKLDEKLRGIINELKKLNSAPLQLVDTTAMEFVVAFCEESPRSIRKLTSTIMDSFDPEEIIEIAYRLSTSQAEAVREYASFFQTLDAETFVLIASKRIDVSLEDLDSTQGSISMNGLPNQTPPSKQYDLWIAARLNALIEQFNSPFNEQDQQELFDFQQFRTLKLAFKPSIFPATSAALIHVGMNFQPHEIVEMTLSAIGSIGRGSEYAQANREFLESLLKDDDLLHSIGGRTLLEDIEQILNSKFQCTMPGAHLDEATRYEVEFAAQIARANNLQLSEAVESLVIKSDRLSGEYIRGGQVSSNFLEAALKSGEAKTFIAILEECQNYPNSSTLTSKQLSTLSDRLEDVIAKATVKGSEINAPDESIDHLKDAQRLLELSKFVPVIREAIDLRVKGTQEVLPSAASR